MSTTKTTVRCAIQGVLCFALLSLVPMQGRQLRIPPMEDMAAQAPIICNGRVVELSNTLKKSTVTYPGDATNSIPTEIWRARIKVLSVYKGKVPDEIELRFPQIDAHPADDKTSIICDGPELLALQASARYRFYLRPVPGQKWYLGALDGNFDEFPAVEPLSDDEPDGNPPLFKSEATKLATDFVKKLNIDIDESQWTVTVIHEATVFDALQGKLKEWRKRKGWTFTFGWPPDHTPGGPEPGAVVEILGDGKIDPSSWVTIKAIDLKPEYLGRMCHIYFKFPLSDKFADYYSVVGRVSKISDQSLEIIDAKEQAASKPSDTPRHWPTLAIPIADIQEVRFIPD